MMHMRSVVATRRQFLAASGIALAGAALTRTAASALLTPPSPNGGTAAPVASLMPKTTPTATPTPAPTPATVTIPVPVIQQSMVLDCETAALQQGLAYYGLNVSQSQLFADDYADVRLPDMGANTTFIRRGNPLTNLVGFTIGSY